MCEKIESALEEFGDQAAQDFIGSVADLRDAAHFTDLPIAPHIYNGESPPECRLDFGSGAIFFTTSHTTPPEKDGKIDWPRVKNIKILRIEKWEQ